VATTLESRYQPFKSTLDVTGSTTCDEVSPLFISTTMNNRKISYVLDYTLDTSRIQNLVIWPLLCNIKALSYPVRRRHAKMTNTYVDKTYFWDYLVEKPGIIPRGPRTQFSLQNTTSYYNTTLLWSTDIKKLLNWMLPLRELLVKFQLLQQGFCLPLLGSCQRETTGSRREEIRPASQHPRQTKVRPTRYFV
jgi:hypothetical protein